VGQPTPGRAGALTVQEKIVAVRKGKRQDLQLAIERGEVRRLRRLLAAGIDVNAPLPNQTTPLTLAAFLKLPATVRLLLDFGADAAEKDPLGYTPIQSAQYDAEYWPPAIIQEVSRILRNARRRQLRQSRTPWRYLGLSRRDWYRLKDAVLYADSGNVQKRSEGLNQLPRRLQDHVVAQLVRRFLDTNQQRYLQEAALVLTDNCDNPWLYLAKS
jgi:hypothetical protein